MSELKTTLKMAVDGSAAMAGIEGVKKSFQNLESSSITSAKKVSQGIDNIATSSDQSASKISASAKRVEKSLENQANRLSMTTAEYARHRAIAAGVSKDVYEPLVSRIDAASKSTANLGMSAAATAAAMRNVPAQITDIVVGLQGGQAPMTVLLQQGGQLKDMFGGVVPAAKALGSTIAGLVSPFLLIVSAAAAFGYAIYKGSEESRRFNDTLIVSGNRVGKTAEDLTRLATSVGAVAGSRGKAVEALDQIAASGKIAGTNLESIATAAVAMNRAVGREISDTVQEFESLGDAPADALAKLNEKYNFLTSAVYEQVKALEKQGRTQEAVALAQDTLAAAFQKQASLVTQNLGVIERAWRGVTGAASTAWEAMKGIGRADTVDDLQTKIRAASDRLRSLQNAGGFGETAGGAAVGGARGSSAGAQKQLEGERARLSAEIQQLQQRSTAAVIKAAQAKTEAERIEALKRNEILDKEVESNSKKRAREIEQVKRDAAITGATAEETAKRVAAINEKYKDPKTAAGKAYRDDAGAKMLLQLKEQEASLRAQADGEKKITDAAKDRAKFEQQIADLKDKKILTADQKSLLASQDAIRTQLDKNVALAAEVKQREALIKLEERSAQIQASMASSQSSRQEQYDRTLSAYGQGDRTQQRVQSESGIRREYQRYQDQLAKAAQDGLVKSDQYIEASRKIAEGQDAALAAQRQFYEQEDQLRGSWQLGFQNAFQNYADAAADAYKSAGNVFGTVFGGMEDRLTTFIAKGKLDFAGFADSIIADMARVYARQAISGLAGLIGQAFAPAVASTASGYSPGSDGFIPTVDITGGRAIGGPVSAGNVYRVNETGAPEMANVGGKQYLLMAISPGRSRP